MNFACEAEKTAQFPGFQPFYHVVQEYRNGLPSASLIDASRPKLPSICLQLVLHCKFTLHFQKIELHTEVYIAIYHDLIIVEISDAYSGVAITGIAASSAPPSPEKEARLSAKL